MRSPLSLSSEGVVGGYDIREGRDQGTEVTSWLWHSCPRSRKLLASFEQMTNSFLIRETEQSQLPAHGACPSECFLKEAESPLQSESGIGTLHFCNMLCFCYCVLGNVWRSDDM